MKCPKCGYKIEEEGQETEDEDDSDEGKESEGKKHIIEVMIKRSK